MIEAVIYALIYICLLALVIYLIIWVLSTVVGVALPPKVVQIIWVIFALVCILILVQMVLPRSRVSAGSLAANARMTRRTCFDAASQANTMRRHGCPHPCRLDKTRSMSVWVSETGPCLLSIRWTTRVPTSLRRRRVIVPAMNGATAPSEAPPIA